MQNPKKFGAFSGVFTPSILTILGVIMYMRFGWVVGQAGFIVALLIILVAHIISFSTGLSISSIATDKRIEKGGIYYMLSRSLGLPMGGTIGIALFIGTAFSISLYIIGFVESFLYFPQLEPFREYLHIGDSINDVRIVGTAVIVFLVIIAFISTSLAIKAQYIILTLIVLSLVSIFAGFYVNLGNIQPDFAPFDMGRMTVSLEEIFSVFFPAVTGFTVGVAMSGDLKNPKKDIPFGTMAAIFTGLVVYISLAVFFGLFMDSETLVTDTNFLMTIAWSSVLLVLGIWGATLSSALGGILGGPRILQALSIDKIAPKFFAKGYGKNNEPRNALLLAFLIAEFGIYLGELNLIARIVTMFYLVSYGFINLAFFLESIASTDFRPSFRIPKFVGLLGVVSCFVVMIIIDLWAMIAAFIIMLLIYSILKRKELQLDFGDVWQSVWTLIIRKGLQRMDEKEIEERNWQPNIMLFSGGTHKRKHLVDFGKYLVGQHGMLSNFELIEDNEQKVLFTKHQQALHIRDEESQGVFTRRNVCRDVYEGIETIARTYGFSGVEPNSVLLGWAAHSHNPGRFAKLIKTLYDLDLNVLLMHYNKERGFGNKRSIDIYWRGGGNNGNLALALSKFIVGTRDWSGAEVRLIVINPVNAESPIIRRNARQIFENLRINAHISIINNQFERKSFSEILSVESENTDLVFLGLSNINPGKEFEFTENTNKLVSNLGTVVLLKASSEFKPLKFDGEIKYLKKYDEPEDVFSFLKYADTDFSDIDFGKNEVVVSQLKKISYDLSTLNKDFHQKFLLQIFRYNKNLTLAIGDLVNRSFDNYEKNFDKGNEQYRRKLLVKIQNNFLINSRKVLNEIQNEFLEAQTQTLKESIDFALDELDKKFKNIPKYIVNYYDIEDVRPDTSDDINLRSFKFRTRLRIRTTGKPAKYTIKLKKIVDAYFPYVIYEVFDQILQQWGLINVTFIIELQKTIKQIRNLFIYLESDLANNKLTYERFGLRKKKAVSLIHSIEELHKKSQRSVFNFSANKAYDILSGLSSDLNRLNANQSIKKRNLKPSKELKSKITKVPFLWQNNQNLIYNAAILELMLLSFENRLRKIISDVLKEIAQLIDSHVSVKISRFHKQLETYVEKLNSDISAIFKPEEINIHYNAENFSLALNELIENTYKTVKNNIARLPETIDLMTSESFQVFEKVQFSGVEIIHLASSRLLDYIVQEELIDPLQRKVDELPGIMQSISSDSHDVLRLVSFSAYQSETPVNADTVEPDDNMKPFMINQKKRMDDLLKQTNHVKQELEHEFSKRLDKTVDKFTLYSLTSKAVSLKQYAEQQSPKKRLWDVGIKVKKVPKFSVGRLDVLWYRRSKAVLLAQKNTNSEANREIQVNDLLNLVETVSPEPHLLNNIPFYYQQLFLKKHNYYKEFWIGRNEELRAAQKAIERYRKGYYGAILIKGHPFSGRTFFSQYISGTYFDEKQIYFVNPPFGGSVHPKVFLETLQKALGIYGSEKQIFEKISPGCVIIIDDLELWWEKSQKGFQVIEYIIKLIDDFSSRCLFIVNVNAFSYEIMRKIKNTDHFFIHILNCEPFDSEALKDILLLRHRSSGLKLRLNNKHREPGPHETARFFNNLFTYSRGNVGIALYTWLAHAVDYHNETIFVNNPVIPDLSRLDFLDREVMLLIVQFVLHKRLSVSRLERITLLNHDYLQMKMNYMKRSGIIIENHKDIYELNPFLSIHLLNKLREKEML